MLVLLGPSFEGSEEAYARLARATALLPYDLKTKCKPGAFGVVRALADTEQARALSASLAELGFPACVVDPAVGHDPARKHVAVREIELGAGQMILHLRERTMAVPYAAVLTLVRAEAQIGRTPQNAATVSSAAFRAINPTSSEVNVFREQAAGAQRDAFAALDLHFGTVLWIARVDARTFEFASEFVSESPAHSLDALADAIAARAAVRVDRNLRSSSVASFTAGHAKSISGAPTSSVPARPAHSDEHFDAYSRLIAEAERQLRKITIR